MGGYCRVFPDKVEVILVDTEFEELIRQMEMTLDDASRSRKQVYIQRHRLRRDMAEHPIFALFVSGSSTVSDKAFHCISVSETYPWSRGGQPSSPGDSLASGTGSSMWPIDFEKTCLFSIG